MNQVKPENWWPCHPSLDKDKSLIMAVCVAMNATVFVFSTLETQSPRVQHEMMTETTDKFCVIQIQPNTSGS